MSIRNVLFSVLITALALSSHALEVTIKADADGSNRPVISGTTNLPSGTTLSVSVERPQTGFDGGTMVNVVDGKFNAGPFGTSGSGLSPGTYKLTVLSVAAGVQDPRVREVIGTDGSKLTGKLIKREKFSGRHAVYSKTFTVGGRADAKSDAKEKADRANKDQVNFCYSGCAMQGFGAGYLLDRCMRSCMRP